MTEANFQKLLTLRDSYLLEVHNVRLYPFQKRISDRVLRTVLYRQSVSTRRTRAKVARQSGKTEAIVATVEFLMVFHRSITGRRIRIGIFAPQREQAKTDFDRLKERLDAAARKGFTDTDPDQSNATTLQLQNGSFCYTFPLTETSNPESKTLDLLIYEEANNINDQHKKRKSDPMGTATNAAEIAVGVGCYHKNFFQRDCAVGGEHVIKCDANTIIAEKQQAFNDTGDEWHLGYAAYVQDKIETDGRDDDAIRTQYFLDDVLGVGQFITETDFNGMVSATAVDHTGHRCVAGIDTAKAIDDTVVTIKCLDCRSIAGWLELHGDNYEDQFDAIVSTFNRYSNLTAIGIDSTGQGDFMPDKFARHTRWSVENVSLFRIKFSLPTKDQMYKNLIAVVRNRQTNVPESYPAKFREQILDLQKEYKGELLSVHHPDDDNAHDDYPDSWAIAEWVAHQLAAVGTPKISFI